MSKMAIIKRWTPLSLNLCLRTSAIIMDKLCRLAIALAITKNLHAKFHHSLEKGSESVQILHTEILNFRKLYLYMYN